MDRGLSLLEERVRMSGYQYYEFRAIDRPLSKRGLTKLTGVICALFCVAAVDGW
jgi:hypothetical protein